MYCSNEKLRHTNDFVKVGLSIKGKYSLHRGCYNHIFVCVLNNCFMKSLPYKRFELSLHKLKHLRKLK
jgi:hypothetical protein